MALASEEQSNGLRLGQGAATVGFFGTEPTSQPTASGNTHTVSGGSGNAAYTNTTFDGGTGTTSYTIGDIVAALKQLGLIAS